MCASASSVQTLIFHRSLKHRLPKLLQLNDIWRNHGGTFNKDLKSWVLPLSRYRTVLADLGGDEVRELPPMISRRVDGTGTFIPPTKRTSEREARAAWEKSLPPRLRESLMPFQEMGVTLAIQRGGRILLGDEMGLGKTLQALSVAYVLPPFVCFTPWDPQPFRQAQSRPHTPTKCALHANVWCRYHYNAEWPLLIICPSSLRFTWQGEITKWLGIETESIQIISSGKQKPESLIVIVSYDIAARIPKALAGFSVVIADEVSRRSDNEQG
jgi:SWI/SNF-related matrix-associated actin-dependent regulator 1 of chromatin subfamily A